MRQHEGLIRSLVEVSFTRRCIRVPRVRETGGGVVQRVDTTV